MCVYSYVLFMIKEDILHQWCFARGNSGCLSIILYIFSFLLRWWLAGSVECHGFDSEPGGALRAGGVRAGECRGFAMFTVLEIPWFLGPFCACCRGRGVLDFQLGTTLSKCLFYLVLIVYSQNNIHF